VVEHQAPIEVNLPAMILDNLLCYRHARAAAPGPFRSSQMAEKRALTRRRDSGALIPETALQAASISARGYHYLPRVRRNRFASIQDEVGDHSFIRTMDQQIFLVNTALSISLIFDWVRNSACARMAVKGRRRSWQMRATIVLTAGSGSGIGESLLVCSAKI